MNSSHLSEEKVEKYSMGRLSQPETVSVEEHLLTCDACQEQVEKMDLFVKKVRNAAKVVEDSPSTWRDRVRAFFTVHPASVWAGASVIGAALVIFTFMPPGGGSPQLVELSTVRGVEAVPHVKAKKPIDLQLDVTEIPVSSLYTVELVTAAGNVVHTYTVEPKAQKLAVPVADLLPSGQYWVRLYGNSLKTELLREYALRVD
jgi:anti-sigma factor RsiW